jgi:hypothetical protein
MPQPKRDQKSNSIFSLDFFHLQKTPNPSKPAHHWNHFSFGKSQAIQEHRKFSIK